MDHSVIDCLVRKYDMDLQYIDLAPTAAILTASKTGPFRRFDNGMQMVTYTHEYAVIST